MNPARDAGLSVGAAFRYINFFYAMGALVRLPYLLFPAYVPDGDRQYNQGEVIRVGAEKYLLQNWGGIDPNTPPPTNPLCKLFRDGGRYPWVREEYCLKGFERYYDDGDPNRTGWYAVTADYVDDATPPPNAPNMWEKVS